jgi:hypothetical protein
VTSWLIPSAGWYLPPQKIPLAENMCLQAGKGAENTKEKSIYNIHAMPQHGKNDRAFHAG